jgi:hypothetical protein
MRIEKTKANGRDLVIREFSGLIDVLDAKKHDTQPARRAQELTDQGLKAADLTSWLGVRTKGALDEAIRKGWADGVKLINKTVAQEMPQAMTLRRQREWGDRGDEFDVHRALRGQHDKAWLSRKRASRSGIRRVVITCGLSCSSGEVAENLVWRGIAALKLSDALEEAGYQVRILGVSGISNVDGENSEDGLMVTQVKDYDQPLDLGALAALLALPGFTRAYLFPHHYPLRSGRTTNYGLGQPNASIEEGYIKKLEEDGEIVFHISSRTNSKDKAEAFLKTAATKIEAFEDGKH